MVGHHSRMVGWIRKR